MPSPFDVTVVPTSLTLTAGKTDELEVTVSNRSGHGLTARAIRVAVPKTAADWLQARDQDEAPLAAGDTRKIRYTVTVPPDAGPQTVRFRVDVADVADPNQLFTQGPTVEVTVQQAEAPHHDPWIKKWWPYLVAAAVIVVVGFGIYLVVKPKSGSVPGVRGLAFDSAQTVLKNAGLTVQRSDTLTPASDTTTFRAGTVVAQSPDSGKAVPKDKTVLVSVQKAWGVVPPVAGNPLATATRAIANQGLVIAAVFQNTSNQALNQTVSSTDPGPNTFLAAGSPVTVNIWTAVARCSPWPTCGLRTEVMSIEQLNRVTRNRAAMRPQP